MVVSDSKRQCRSAGDATWKENGRPGLLVAVPSVMAGRLQELDCWVDMLEVQRRHLCMGKEEMWLLVACRGLRSGWRRSGSLGRK